MRFGYLMVFLLFGVIGAAVVRTYQLSSPTDVQTPAPIVPNIIPVARLTTPTRSLASQTQPTITPVRPTPAPTPTQSTNGGPPTGALIKWVDIPSAANKVGIKQSDIITMFDGIPADANHFLVDLIESKKPGDNVRLTVIREGQTIELTPQLRGSPWDNNVAYLGVRYVQQGSAPPDIK